VVEGLLLRDTIAQLQRGYTEVIVTLVRAVEAKDVYTRGHTQRVSEMAMRLGQELKLPHEQLRVLARAAMLHDIGKIGVPDSILTKPGPLSEEEFEVIKQHPGRGHDIIKDVRSLQAEVGGVRHHHERWDGAGYPDGLSGETIPLEARIIAVADVFDALTSPRPYRGAWTRSRALAQIRQQSGQHFDPRCVDALVRVLEYQEGPRPVADSPDEQWVLAAS
jgi:HD-GYP domain-containing protein (c-di-GMP phosphodiesterase class II)